MPRGRPNSVPVELRQEVERDDAWGLALVGSKAWPLSARLTCKGWTNSTVAGT